MVPKAGGLIPMKDRWQALVYELGIRRSLIPTDAAHGIIVLPLWIVPEVPGRRRRSIGLIDKQGHGLFKGEGPTVSREWISPILLITVAARIDEFLEFDVGDLILVDQEIIELHRRESGDAHVPRRNVHHVFGKRAVGIENEILGAVLAG